MELPDVAVLIAKQSAKTTIRTGHIEDPHADGGRRLAKTPSDGGCSPGKNMSKQEITDNGPILPLEP